MRRDIEMREPERDPVLAAALRELHADAPLDAERAQVLRGRIRAQAESMVAAQQSAPAAQARVANIPARTPSRSPRFRRPLWAVPALLAAAAAAVLLVGRRERGPVPAPGAAAPVAAVGFSSAEQALSAEVSDAEFARVLLRENDPAALLAIAVEGTAGTPSR